MKKTVILKEGVGAVEIETNGTLWGFRAGDIITNDKAGSGRNKWRNRQVKVEGFEDGRLLYGTVVGEDRSLYVYYPDGLVFLERPGLKFKVGDRVRNIWSDEPTTGKEGVVIVMDPDVNLFNYLVEFDDFDKGHNEVKDYYDKPWYPSKYKTESHSRSWCSGNGLELVSAAPSHQQSEPMFKVGQKVRVIGGKNCGSEGFVSEMEKFQGQVMTVQTVFREDRKSCDCSYHLQLEEDDYCVWSSKWLEPIEEEEKKASLVPVVSDATNGEAKPACAKSYGEAKEVIEVQEGMPEWLKEMILNIKAGVAHFFIVWGNIYDLQKNQKSAYTSLYQCLLEAFEQREMIMSYSVSGGLQFANPEMEKMFRQQCLRDSQNSDEQKKQSAVQAAAKQRQDIESQMPLEKTPDKILPLFEKILANVNPESSGKKPPDR